MLSIKSSSFLFLSLSLSFLCSTTEAQCNSTRTVNVQVGQNGLTFSPSTITAAQGSTINFHFDPRNHSVAESGYTSPCQYLDGGMWSGYIPSSSGVASTMFSVKLNDTDPHWLYCSQGNHCQSGMVMVINPPANSADNLQAYTSAAENASQSTAGNVVTGGLIVANSNGSSSTSSTTTSSSTSTVASSTHTGLAAVNEANVWLAMAVGLMWVV